MKKLLITSTRTSAGKTMVGAGIVQHPGAGSNTGYFKPFADRLIQSDKTLVDCDVKLFLDLLGIDWGKGGFSVDYDYDALVRDASKEKLADKLVERFGEISAGKDLVFLESARNFSYGAFAGLDSISLCSRLDLEMILVADGDPGLVIDKCIIVEDRIKAAGIELVGVIINKVQPHVMEDMKTVAVAALEKRGLDVLGIIPEDRRLATYTVGFLSSKIGARVLAGHDGLDKTVEKTLVGAMTADTAMHKQEIYEPNNLIITGGDRVDMILLAMETESSAVLLTGNLVPHPRIMAKADDLAIPVLTVPMDTFRAAKHVERVEALILAGDEEKIRTAGRLVEEHVNFDILGKHL